MKEIMSELEKEPTSNQDGVMWRLSVIFILPMAVVFLFTNMIVTAFEWILTGTNHRFTSWMESFWDDWMKRITGDT
jgi:hypothetical protein